MIPTWVPVGREICTGWLTAVMFTVAVTRLPATVSTETSRLIR
jgi:hypothetical protein